MLIHLSLLMMPYANSRLAAFLVMHRRLEMLESRMAEMNLESFRQQSSSYHGRSKLLNRRKSISIINKSDEEDKDGDEFISRRRSSPAKQLGSSRDAERPIKKGENNEGESKQHRARSFSLPADSTPPPNRLLS